MATAREREVIRKLVEYLSNCGGRSECAHGMAVRIKEPVSYVRRVLKRNTETFCVKRYGTPVQWKLKEPTHG